MKDGHLISKIKQMNPLVLNLILSKILRKSVRLMKILEEKLIAISLKLNPWTGLNGLDYKIAKLLPHLLNKDTFYIEVGANDGINQSNTYFLESIYGARGLLIEASPSNFEKCIRNRSKKNIFEHCALVSTTFQLPY